MSPESNAPGMRPSSRHEFGLAAPEEEPALRQLALNAPSHGTLRLGFDRSPDYFASLAPEGQCTEVLLCRDRRAGRLVAVGHRSIRTLMVNGQRSQVGYLGGLRIAPEAQKGFVLARGYQYLRQRHGDARVRFYLSTIMEDNQAALDLLRSGRCGLPFYQDMGRYCCLALAAKAGQAKRPPGVDIREASPADAQALFSFLDRESVGRQFFPVHTRSDFCAGKGVLPGLGWKDILLALKGAEIIGVLAGWNQLPFRRWHVSGYAPWLSLLRHPLNIIARFRNLPALPRPDSSPNYRLLALPCIRDFDTNVFAALLETLLGRCRRDNAFLIAGLHERDPLAGVLLKRPHVAMPSRLFAVCWEDGIADLRGLRGELIPYLELGSL